MNKRPTDGPRVAAPEARAIGALSASEALSRLGSRWEGLTPDEAEKRSDRARPNRLPASRHRELVRALLSQFTHFFALTLWAAAGLALIGGLPELSLAIALVVVVNGVFSFAQEYRAERATRALAALLPPMTQVLRGGERQTIAADRLALGDLLVLEEGARIPADARVVRATGLMVDNSALTGESDPIPRSAEPDATLIHDGIDGTNLVYAGTWVLAGSATAVVFASGGASRLGTITEITAKVERRLTPLHESTNRAVRGIVAIALSAGAAFIAISLLLGMRLHDSLLFSVGVMVALVPEGLLPTLTLALAMGATRMSRRGVLVRNLEAVETLGSTTVICTDKTGTLTANQMTVARVWTFDGALRTTGTGYAPHGTLMVDDRPLSRAQRDALAPLLVAAALCGDARIERRDGKWRGIGDPTEAALVVLARKGGIRREDAERDAPRVDALPFSSARRRMTTMHALATGQRLLLSKGSPEAVVPRCCQLLVSGETRPLGLEERARIDAEVLTLAREGLRVLALAERHAASEQPIAEAEADLTFLGLIAMHDPIRPEVPAAIARCRSAGIRVLIVTGDHPSTASAVARQVGLEGEALVGADLPNDDDALADRLLGPVAVLARVAPEQKLAIARALQQRGEVVAMSGDGVNDAPALRQADIGIAMGASGTDVAREAADLVLLDDDFSHVVEAIEEGRAAFANIRRFLTYHLTDNVAELAPFLCWALSGGTFPLLLSVLQILALDIGTDLLPALALGAEPAEGGVMHERPRARATPLLDRSLLVRALGFLGPLEAVISLSVAAASASLLLGWRPGTPFPDGASSLALLSTLTFTAIVLMQVANALACRSDTRSVFAEAPWSNRLLAGALVFELALLAAFIYLPALQRVLGHHPLPPAGWALAAAAPITFLAAEELRKLATRWRKSRRAA